MSEQVLASLAILKVNWDHGSDYIENFVPFVAECLRKSSQPEVSLPELQSAITNTFGLRIPQGALKTILKRAAKHGYVERKDTIYLCNESKLSVLDIARVRDDVLRRHEALISKLITFCESRYRVKWSQEEAEGALLAHLQERLTPILATAIEGQPIASPNRSAKHSDFLVNSFIVNLHENDPEGFEFLETIVKGSMLANVLLFPDFSKVHQSFKQVEVYFDTAFLLRALGLNGIGPQVPCRELIDLLYEENAELRCFEHTIEEIRRVLDFAARALQNSSYLKYPSIDLLEYFATSNYRASDVEFIIATLDKSLHALHIQIKPKSPFVPALGLDETKFESMLQNEVHYRSQSALRHDLDSLTAIHRLRRGRFPGHIESCDAIFVTTNSPLAKASALFFKQENADALCAAPHCMLDYHLTTLVWLKKPLRAPDLPRKRIVADCYAALNPTDALWKSYLGEIERLREQKNISKEDYDLLRHSMDAKTALMDLTMGDADTFTEGTVQEVLDMARAAARAETESALMAQKDRATEAERKASEADTRFETRQRAQLERFRILGEEVGNWVARSILALSIVIVSLGTYLTLPDPFPKFPGDIQRLILPCASVVAVATVASLLFGTTIRSVTRQIELRTANFIERELKRIMSP